MIALDITLVYWMKKQNLLKVYLNFYKDLVSTLKTKLHYPNLIESFINEH